ncbi:MAG: hypothetical protein GY950_08235 [bacterium]|nr:hypothetical protein [bacterium]
MAKKNHIPQKLAPWIEARRRHRLSHAHIQMARELGMNPKRFGKIDNSDQEAWKMPLPHFIEHLYFKRFGRDRPENVRSIEQLVKDLNKKKEIRKKWKEEKRNEEAKRIESEQEPLEDPF